MLIRVIIIISLFLVCSLVLTLSLLGRASSHSGSQHTTIMSTQQQKQQPQQQFTITARNRSHLTFDDTEEAQWQGAFTFIQAADTQLGLQERYVERKPNPGWSQEVAWTRQMVEDVNKMRPRPRFLVICGDLVDAYPVARRDNEGTQENEGNNQENEGTNQENARNSQGNETNHNENETNHQENERKQQEMDLKEVLQHLEIPLVCVCGNHDIGDSPNPDTIAKYKSSFGDDYYSFWVNGVIFLALNSQFWQDDSQATQLSQQHDSWLNTQLEVIKAKKPRYAMVFQHIPPFLHSVDEPKEYFNLEPGLRRDILNRFKAAGVSHVFCGHYHRNAGGFYGELEVIVTSAVGAQLGTDVNGYRVVSVMEDRVEHQYFGLGDDVTDVNNVCTD